MSPPSLVDAVAKSRQMVPGQEGTPRPGARSMTSVERSSATAPRRDINLREEDEAAEGVELEEEWQEEDEKCWIWMRTKRRRAVR